MPYLRQGLMYPRMAPTSYIIKAGPELSTFLPLPNKYWFSILYHCAASVNDFEAYFVFSLQLPLFFEKKKKEIVIK